ncbi:hypothetical protein [Kyrpidia tusciae]|uniref:Type 4 fimbrial biogenesis protein PilX N-terminal domain-containing protein n=1 Tax=Kyrpidia tusciae (strain DSM 2912 / NBRC 15312 / T2) TaxID=562970 RepID=D5WWH8_KYRT2|nr:hypothetical protein [Kyrpidia tusciae]ADG07743.1 hypothetical protein Btus_3129 [Kyrpidia tusciae DSM 2912]
MRDSYTGPKRGKHGNGKHPGQRRHDGFTLVAVLLVAVILLTLLAAVSTMVLAESKQTGLTARQQQAYNLAETGLERFMAALQTAAQGDLSQFPYDSGTLARWVQTQGIQQPPRTVVQATYIDENGTVVTSTTPPYPHLIQVRSTGTADGVQKTVVATVDLQYLGNIFRYVLAATAGTGTGIQFDSNMSLSLYGSMYTDADLAVTNSSRKIPSSLMIQNGTLDLGPDSPLSGTEQWFPTHVSVRKLTRPLAVPSFDDVVVALQAGNGNGSIQTFSSGGTHYLFEDLWGGWWDLWQNGGAVAVSPVDPSKPVLMFNNPDAQVIVLGNPAHKTVVVSGELTVYAFIGDTSPPLYVAKKNVLLDTDFVQSLGVAFDVFLQNLLDLLRHGGDIRLPKLVPGGIVSGYIFAPNGNVTARGDNSFQLIGSIIGQRITFDSRRFLGLGSLSASLQQSTDGLDQKIPWYVPRPVVVDRHTE